VISGNYSCQLNLNVYLFSRLAWIVYSYAVLTRTRKYYVMFPSLKPMQKVNLLDDDKELLQQAIGASDRLYMKGLQEVGSALRTKSGEIFTGINIEAANDWAGICGEMATISCMVSAGRRDLDSIAAVWRSPEGQHYLLPPCGRCREIISDLNPCASVILSTMDNHWDLKAIENVCKVEVSELLPVKSHRLRS